ncbi:MAG TPA: efflux RND transporter periplasmic adaptor subunit [Verrucomicrobiae bacterium]|nr:efflux RND transporter periplasmic adaptor subunit [Verrucomicrobiae bacterium]
MAAGPLLVSCGGRTAVAKSVAPGSDAPEIGVVRAVRKSVQQNLVVSSELVPFQQIDVYAKESGFVQKLYVDYGTHVQAGQVMAVLEIPELQVQLDEDQAAIRAATDQVGRMQNNVSQVEAQQKDVHLQFSRLDAVAKSQPGLVAQQEVDDWRSKDLAAGAQAAAAQNILESARSELMRAQARQRHDQVLYDYAKIVAPFSGVVTKRYANYGTLMQSGINSTQALPLVQLSEDDLFRLVIPVPETYVESIHVGDKVDVRVPALNRALPGQVKRFSVDVDADTRTMHTEVDVPNTGGVLMPGMYAEATLTITRIANALTVPPQAVVTNNGQSTVWVVGPDNRIEIRNLTIGTETPNDVEILSGLKAGEMVATGDRASLKQGETVRPKEVQLIQYNTSQ